nr:MAG TPA: hypothetical protein [Caudoviricetes sp.]
MSISKLMIIKSHLINYLSPIAINNTFITIYRIRLLRHLPRAIFCSYISVLRILIIIAFV